MRFENDAIQCRCRVKIAITFAIVGFSVVWHMQLANIEGMNDESGSWSANDNDLMILFIVSHHFGRK